MKKVKSYSNTVFFATILFTVFASNISYSQNTQDGDYPVNAIPGKCYAKCYLPDQYEMQATQVIDKPSSYRYVNIPAVFENVVDTILVKPATTKYELVPAVFEEVIDTILVSGPTTRWVKGKADPSCLSDNPENCKVMCLENVPAEYHYQKRKKIASPAYTKSIEIPAEYKYVSRTVMKTPAAKQAIEVPATFRTINQNVLVRKGGFSEWKEILCASKINEEKILQIQQALRAKGYNPGAVDNVMGAQTKAALLQFQKDKHLPEGNLNIETLVALGIQ